MPEADVIKVKKPRTEVYAVSGLLALGGLGMVLFAITRGKQDYGPIAPLEPGEDMRNLGSPILDQPGVLYVTIGQWFAATFPTVEYVGPGRDTYSHFRVVQTISGEQVTVYGSGVAGVHVGPANVFTEYPLVSPDEVQPGGCPVQSLCAEPWPGTEIMPICGTSPQPGAATVLLEIYERKRPEDADGFASPTCNQRIPVMRRVSQNKVQFV